jgi:hypothetical protein
MPTVMKIGPYRLYFYSHESNEPPHIHIDRDSQSCKFWIHPVVLARNLGFGPKELRTIEALIIENSAKILEAWNAYFEY